ncbi:MAG: GlmU family protein [Bacteroidetes bacterium]|nr:GlmU family protein [Bacteroidota bacterium]
MANNIILWDGLVWEHLLPFTYTRPAAQIRIGILTIEEKYQMLFGGEVSHSTKPYLSKKFAANWETDNLIINAGILPTEDFAMAVNSLADGEILIWNSVFAAGRFTQQQAEDFAANPDKLTNPKVYEGSLIYIDRPWKIFQHNDAALNSDFDLLTKGRTSQPIAESNFVVNKERIFLEEGAIVQNASLNASGGAIYIGKDAEVMEGSTIRGGFALGEHSQLKLGAKIYGATTIGPHCKVGGEVNNSVIFGFSNKAHDGFLGNAVVGEWCNIGADSNNSNLKNNYEEVKIWSFSQNTFVKTGMQFCGLFLGDHSKCGINTMFNTGTVVGVSSNIFGGGFPRTFIPSFAWGGAAGFTTYKIDKAFETAEKVFQRRGLTLTEEDKDILKYIYENTPIAS